MERVSKVFHVIKRDRQLMFGLIGFAILLLIVIFAPFIATHDPMHYSADVKFPPGTGGHFLGTDKMGQDIYSSLVYGLKTSLRVAVISSLISGAIGVMIGGISGFFGGRVDTVISELINIFLMIPTFFLILLIVSLFGNSLNNVMIVIGLTSWPGNAKLMRAQALSLRERTFVRSAIAMGENRRQVLFKYILPNGIFPVVANTTRSMSGAILTEAALSFLGLGDPNALSWGQMIYAGKTLITSAWWISAFPGIAVVVTVIIFYLIGDGLNHVLDPKYQYGRKRA